MAHLNSKACRDLAKGFRLNDLIQRGRRSELRVSIGLSLPALAFQGTRALCAFDAVGCIVAPAAGISVTDVDPARAGLLKHAFDLIKDVAEMLDK